ncbi:MAG: glycosyltransferase [Candidatus Paceibacterota bacterium]
MKILYLITGLHTGGAEMLIRDICERVDKDTFEIIVVSVLPIGEIGDQIKRAGTRVISLDVASKFNPLSFWKLRRILKTEKPDILHTHLFHADILGRIAGSLTRIPINISTIHNMEFGGSIRERLLRWTRSLVDKNIAVSKMVADNAVKKGIVSKDKVQVIYNGIDLEKFPDKNKKEMRERLNIPQEMEVFVSVGSLTQQKGYQYLIQAVDSIEAQALFIILGEGAEREKLEIQIKEHGLQGIVILKGNVDNVNEYLQAADYFVMPSLWEGFSVALLEAAWAGKIIIATDVGGNGEIIKDAETGFLIPSKDSKSLTKKINNVLSLPAEEKNHISQQAQKAVKEKFSINNMVEKHERVYLELDKKYE